MKTVMYVLAASGMLCLSACSRSGKNREETPAAVAEPQSQATTAAAEQGESDTPGLAVGEEAPSFRLKDQEGREHTFEKILEKGNAALVFFRSADW